jgi:uncharacterized protein involved in exopolysaccharide biosynthesis
MLEHEIQLTPNHTDANSLGVSGIVEAIFRQRWKMLLVMGVVFGLDLFWTFGTPKRFTSEMVLLVQNARGNEVVTSAQSGNTASVNDVSEEQLNSEVAVLNSDDILNEVVDPEWSRHSQDSKPYADQLAHEQAVRSIRGRLDVSPIRSSHAITIKMVATTPEAARETLTQLLQAFLRKQRELGRLPGASKVFTQQVDQYEKDLEVARRNLADYQNKHGFVSLNAQEAALEMKLRDLQSATRDTDVQINELNNRIIADRQQLAATSQRVTTVNQSSPATGTIDQLNVLLISLQNKRTELVTKFNPNDRLVKEVDQQIADTMAGITQATTMRPREVSSDVNPLWQVSQRDLTSNLIALTGMHARHASLTSQIASLQSDLNNTELQSGDYEALQQRVMELEESYKAFVQKRDNSLMSDLMDEKQWLNVAVIQYPTLSLGPSHPQPKRDLILGLFAAVLLGCCAVFLFETMRQQVSTPAELEGVSRYPVLASIPYAPSAIGIKDHSGKSEESTGRLITESGRALLDQSRVPSPAAEPQT